MENEEKNNVAPEIEPQPENVSDTVVVADTAAEAAKQASEDAAQAEQSVAAPKKNPFVRAWNATRGFFVKLFRKKKAAPEEALASLNTWEKAEYAVANVTAQQAEAERLQAEAEKARETAEKLRASQDENAKEEAEKAATLAEQAATAAKAQEEEVQKAIALREETANAVAQAAENWKTYRVAAMERAEKEAEIVSEPQVAYEAAVESEPLTAVEKGEEEVHYKEMSPARMVLRRFFRSRLSLVGLIMLVALFVLSFLGPPIFHLFGYEWSETTVDYTPTLATAIVRVQSTDASGETIDAYQIIEQYVDINTKAPPSVKHFLGTDTRGMDVFIRLLYGGRISLTLGFVVVILETLLGVLLGGLAGYFGKWVDQVIMRIVDIFNCIPTLPILLIASAVIDSWHVPGQMQIYYLMVILTIFGWSGTARLVRGQILYLREQEYIVACEVMGIPVWRRIFRHLIPNIMPQLIVSMTLGLGGIILYESTLSYLGLGIPIPYAAWGTMISSATDPLTLAYYPNLWIPAGILIIIAVLGFNFVGDGLRDAMDPKSKR